MHNEKELIIDNEVAKNITIINYHNSDCEIKGDKDLFYDLASLTKVFCGTLIIKLHEQHRLHLDDKVSDFVNLDCNATISELLMHTSGLTDKMIKSLSNEEIVLDLSNYEKSNKRLFYADINYILLYKVIQSLGDYPSLIREEITKELNIFYKPVKENDRFAPTEIREDRGLVQGEVHDNKCYKLGSVSGHAGLFANAEALSTFFERFIKGDIVSLGILEDYKVKTEDVSRNLLFETRNKSKQMGTFEGNSYFHTGFTGTSILLDLNNRSFICILTNRIYPKRTNEKIFEYRRYVHDYFYKKWNLGE